VIRSTRYHAARQLIGAAPKPLYHGSRERLDIGTVLRPREGGYMSLPDEDIASVEDILEKHRPEGKIPRHESVFMLDDPGRIEKAGGRGDHVYVVEPIGAVEASDLGWYAELSVYWIDMPEDERRGFAEGYWSGDPFPGRKKNLYEYRTRAAEVVGNIESPT
jgi:hypothetical protein